MRAIAVACFVIRTDNVFSILREPTPSADSGSGAPALVYTDDADEAFVAPERRGGGSRCVFATMSTRVTRLHASHSIECLELPLTGSTP